MRDAVRLGPPRSVRTRNMQQSAAQPKHRLDSTLLQETTRNKRNDRHWGQDPGCGRVAEVRHSEECDKCAGKSPTTTIQKPH